VTEKPVLFIDANQYLDLYRMVSGKKLLAGLEEQKDYIFVTSQLVREVSRNKVKVAASFLVDATKKIELSAMAVPDHMLSAPDDRVQRLGKRLQELREEVAKVKGAFRQLTRDLLAQVSQSQDDVSKTLTVIFSAAAEPSADELTRAKERKEFGDPPGKNNDALGDQVSWEQLLTKCKNKPSVWIITKDSDYATKYEGEIFLNARLYDELTLLYQEKPEVFCFDNIADGLKHFVATTSVKAEKSPTPDETDQIKKEQNSLPPLGPLVNSVDPTNIFVTPKLTYDATQFADIVAGSKLAYDASQFTNILASTKVGYDTTELADILGSSKLAYDSSQFTNILASTKVGYDTAQLADIFASSKLAYDASQFANIFASSKMAYDVSQFANVFVNPNLAFDASQLTQALDGLNANVTLAAAEFTKTLSGLTLKATPTANEADRVVEEPESNRQKPSSQETEGNKGST
jgi:hypothetical protein